MTETLVMPRDDAELSLEERDELLQIAAKMPELMYLALQLGAETVAERLVAVEECAIDLLATHGASISKR